MPWAGLIRSRPLETQILHCLGENTDQLTVWFGHDGWEEGRASGSLPEAHHTSASDAVKDIESSTAISSSEAPKETKPHAAVEER